MHNAALAATGLGDWRYQRLPVAPELATETLTALGRAGLRGVNVTIPHKAAALALATDPTERARAIGAANTLVYEADGRITADNTDAPGLITSLRSRDAAVPRSALVLGAGGSARAAVWALRDAGVGEVRVWNRTAERARALAAELGAEVAAEAAPAELLVNCTALGLDGADPFAGLPLGPGDLSRFAIVVDFVYTPHGTRLIDAARERGAVTVDGLELLVAQGALSFERFTGRPAPVEVMARAARSGR
jgi:shikimate dehydrogenase